MLIQRVVRSFYLWKNVPQGPEDPVLGILKAFLRDKNPRKVNLGQEAYRDDSGKPVVLESVKKAKQLLIKTPDHEYLPIQGLEKFTTSATELAFSDTQPARENRIASIQSLSGTGALRLGIDFIRRFYPHAKEIYIPNPTSFNHKAVITDSGIPIKQYSYYDPNSKALDFENLLADVEEAPKNSIFLLHASAHNPSGVDPTRDQ